MGRKSALTEKQWAQIEQRLVKGDSARSLAREFSISEAAIRKRFGAQAKQIKDVANQLVMAETAFAALPISAQISARSLADELKEISGQLLGAARFSASTAHRLAGIANAKVALIDDANPLDEQSRDELKGIAALTRISNDAAHIPLSLFKANKEVVDDLNKAAPPDEISEIMASINGTSLPLVK